MLVLPLVAATMGYVGVATAPAQAAESQPQLVTDIPATDTVRVVGGQCYGSVADPTLCRKISTMVKIGNWIYAGGIIDKVANTNGSNVRSGFSNLIRFNALTRALDPTFQPQLFRTVGRVHDAGVDGLAASADGSKIYVAGEFTTVKSSPSSPAVARSGIVQLDAETGAVISGFAPKVCQGGGACTVYDVRLIGQQVWIGGGFTKVESLSRPGLASLDPDTGAVTNAVTIPVTGRAVATTPPKVIRIKPNPDSTKAVIIGNFNRVGTVTREEVALVNISPVTGAATSVNSWNAPTALHAAVTNCSPKHYWPRDTDWSPDGSSFVIVGTGAGGGHPYPAPCDAYTKWLDNDSPNSTPVGYNHTEIDTINSVCNVGTWSYVGGHFKSLNQEVRINGVVVKPARAQINETHYGMGAIDNSTYLAVTDWNHSDQTGRGEGWGAVLCIPGPAAQGGGVYYGGDSVGVNGNPQIQRLAYFRAAD